MVIFQAPGGSPGYNQFESLDEAVAFVETLRNDQSVTNARMFALEEIKFELKPFFKVELQALNAGEPVQTDDPAPGTDAVEDPAQPEQQPYEQPESQPETAPMAAEPAAAAPPPPAEPPPAEPAPMDEPAPASTFGAFTDQEPAPAPAPAPAAPAPAPPAEPTPEQPARRGLFGR
ncbi:MAG: hypothetical protein ACR2OH_07170 [Microthrixaceae bacterium]